MGKGVLIFSILSVVIFSTIMLSLINSSSELPETVRDQEMASGASRLGEYALNYGMKEVVDGVVTGDITNTYNDFDVLNGTINSLQYDFDFQSTTNLIQILADVSWFTSNDTVHHQAEAHLEFIPGSEIDPYKTGYWYFDEGTGDNTEDSTENENDATAVNFSNPDDDWEDDRFENGGQSMGFDNSFWDDDDEYFSVEDDGTLDPLTEGSCEAWVYLEWPPIPFAGILHKGERANWTDEAYSLQFWTTGREAAFAVRNSSNQVQVVVGPSNLQFHQWYYIVGTWNEEEVAVWVDGIKVASEDNTIGAVRNSDSDLQIGSQLSNGNAHGYYNEIFGFSGRIDDAAVRNQAYSQDDIEMNYINGSMSAYWRFEEGSGNFAYDKSMNGNTGTLFDGYHANGVTLPQWVTGKFGTALEFNGFDNMVSVPNSSSMNLRESGTISFWAKPFSLDYDSGYIHKGDNSNLSDECYSFENDGSNRRLKLKILKPFLWWTLERSITSNTAVPLNTWSYLAATWDTSGLLAALFGSDARLDLYVNGNVNGAGFSILDARTNNSHLNIGAKTRQYLNSTKGNYGFDGQMDEVRLFYRKLRTPEITKLENYDPDVSEVGDDSYKIVYWRK